MDNSLGHRGRIMEIEAIGDGGAVFTNDRGTS